MMVNALLHALLIAINMAQVTAFFRFRRRPAHIVLGLFLILTVFPSLLLLAGNSAPIIGRPYFIALYFAFAAELYRRFVLEAGFKQIFFAIVSTILFLQVTYVLAYVFMLEALAVPATDRNNIIARLISFAAAIVSVPLCRWYVRPRFGAVLEAVERQKTWFALLLSASLFSLGNASISLFLARSEPGTLRICLIIIFCIIVFYYTLYRFIVGESANQQLKSRAEAAERLADTYSFYDAELKRKDQTIRSLRHDFRHMVLHLGTLLKEKDYAGVAKHLDEIAGRTIEMRPTPYCENMAVNTLVTYYFTQAEEKGIACTAKLFVPGKLAVPAADLAAILGNALENSLHGAESMGDVGYISLSAMPVKDCIVFDIENSYRPGGYRKGSGVGLSSIKSLCEKNGGRAETTDEGGKFRLSIVLKMG